MDQLLGDSAEPADEMKSRSMQTRDRALEQMKSVRAHLKNAFIWGTKEQKIQVSDTRTWIHGTCTWEFAQVSLLCTITFVYNIFKENCVYFS